MAASINRAYVKRLAGRGHEVVVLCGEPGVEGQGRTN